MWSRTWDTRDELSPDLWVKIGSMLAEIGIRAVELFGGDVLLRKDVLYPLIKRLKRSGLIVHIPTNCNLFDRDAAEMLVDSRVDYLYLSTDGIDGLHDEIRGSDEAFQRVRRAVTELVKCRNRSPYPRVVCNTTVSRYNVEFLEQIADFARDSGFDEIHFEYVGEFWPEDVETSAVDDVEPTLYYMKDQESSLVSPQQASLVKEKLERIRKQYLTSSLAVTTLNVDALSELHLVEGNVPHNSCYTERCEITVDPVGNVVACPFFHSYRLGNLLKDEFETIWWGERHQRFHMQVKDQGLPMCRHCILSVQRNHSFPARLKRICKSRAEGIQKKLASRSRPNGYDSC
jgi:radical SAM protein with 4Fe4S-binding SPASM domain